MPRTTEQRARDNIRAWRADPLRFVREVLRVEPDDWQRDALLAFPSSPRMALVACKGPGKTALESWLAWNFLATRPHPKVAATAITGANLRDNLWAEMALWRGRSPFLTAAFEIQGQRISAKDHPETWFMAARAWSRDANEEQQGLTLAGFRADYVLFILDEAGGIPDAVAQKAEANLSTGKEGHIILGGNPTHLTGPLYRAATEERAYWHVVEVTGDPDDPRRSPRVSEQWAREMIDRYGRESSIVQVDVFGKFPSAATDALVSRAAFENAFSRYDSDEPLMSTPRVIGVDVARFGTDRTVIVFRDGDYVSGTDEWSGQDTQYTASRIMEAVDKWAEGDGITRNEISIMVDDIGVGGGVTDTLFANDYAVTGVNVGSAAFDAARFANLRAELNCKLQERFRLGGIAIAPEVRKTTLLAEGTTLRTGYAPGSSKRKIEEKVAYKNRTGRSPDYWDALTLAFHPSAGMALVEF